MTKQKFLDWFVSQNNDIVVDFFHYFGVNFTNYYRVNIRDLYDFFEYYDFIIVMKPVINDSIVNYKPQIMDNGGNAIFESEQLYSNRWNAELNAFYVAYERLNF